MSRTLLRLAHLGALVESTGTCFGAWNLRIPRAILLGRDG